MLSFTGGLKTFVALEPCDMRKGLGSLSGAVYDQLKEDVRNGALYVLANSGVPGSVSSTAMAPGCGS